MKRVLLIVLLSFVSVVGAVGLLVGGMYLVGGFNEKIVYADNLVFNKTEVVSDNAFFLKISTTSSEVTQTRLKLYTSTGNTSSVISFPEYVELDEIFTVVPKQVYDNDLKTYVNFGGNVTLYAAYDGDSSSQIAPAKCEILIDIPVENVKVNFSSSIARPNQVLVFAQKDDALENTLLVSPNKAVMPYVNFGTMKISEIEDKALFLELTDMNGNEITSNVAQFTIDGVEQNSNVVKVNYRYDSVRRKIVFNNTICVNTKNYQGQININAYIYSTYKKQNLNINASSNVEFVKGEMQSDSAYLEIGDYLINGFTFNDSDKEIMLDLNSDNRTGVSLYLNNPNCNASDINLNIVLQSSSPNIVVSDFYMQNLYLKIEDENFGQLFNGEENINNNQVYTENGVRNKFVGISTEKDEWCWNIVLNNFLVYKDYMDNNKKLTATLKYIEYEDEQTKEEIKTEITKTFYIVPTTIEVEDLVVSYNNSGDTSFNVKSGQKLQIAKNELGSFVQIDNENLQDKNANINILPNNSTFNALNYYLSYSENYNGVKTIPTSSADYKVTFKFTLENNGNFYSIEPYNNSWYTFKSIVLKQNGRSDYVSSGNYFAIDTTGFKANEDIYVEMQLTLTGNSDSANLFRVSFSTGVINIGLDNVKFYEVTGKEAYTNNNIYSDIPYLSVNGIRFYIDYEFVYDEITNTKFLRLIFDGYTNSAGTDNLFKLNGIGSFIITVKLSYVDNAGVIYWLNRSVNFNVSVYEDLEDINVYKYENNEKAVFGSLNIEKDENDSNTYYLFLNSSTMQTLKNYVNYNQIEIFTNQLFYKRNENGFVLDSNNNKVLLTEDELSIYTGIKNINKNVITFGSFENVLADENSSNIIGYKLSYTIGEVKTISIDGIEYNPVFEIIFRAKVNDEYIYGKYVLSEGENNTRETSSKLIFEINDKVLNNAEIKLGNNSYETSNKALEIYASGLNTDNIIFKTVEGNTNVDFNNLSYYFEYNNSEKTKSTETLYIETTVDSKVNQEGLLNFNVNFENGVGKGGLILNNFPYFEDGVLVCLTVGSSSLINENSYYVWNHDNQDFELTSYELRKSIYFKVWGFKVDISVNENINNIFGKKDEDITLFGEEEIFTINVYSAQKNKSNTIILTKLIISDYSKILNIYFGNNNLVLSNERDYFTPSVDFVEDTVVMVRFFVGSNPAGNLIRINAGTESEPSYVQSFNITIISPFILTIQNTEFFAPSSNDVFLVLTYGGERINLDNYNVNMSASVLSTTLSSEYEVDYPITITNNRSTFQSEDKDYSIYLNIKSAPCDYNATIKVQIALIVDDSNFVNEKEIVIDIFKGFKDEDIKLNPTLELVEGTDDSYENVDLDLDGYCNIIAGQEYFYSKGNTSSTIVLEGLFVDATNPWVDKITNMQISFEDDDEINYPYAENLMFNTSFNTSLKSFSIGSYELNVQKKIIIKFTIYFNDNGFVILTKKVKVSPNITLSLNVSSLQEGNTISLNDNSIYNYTVNGVSRIFDISSKFDLYDNTEVYGQDSFILDEDVFTESFGTYAFTFMVRTTANNYMGGAAACDGETEIVFYYSVLDNNDIERYKLVFTFSLEILPYAS